MTKVAKVECLAVQDKKAALAEMNEALRAKFDVLSKKYGDMQKKDVLSRYDLGREVNGVIANEKKYGENSRGLLAAGLCITLQELSCYQAIAKAWTREEVDELLAQAEAAGFRTFGYTHLTHLARLEDSAERKAMTKQCLVEMLNVRALQAMVQGVNLNARPNSKGRLRTAPKTPHAGLLQLGKFTTDVATYEPLAMKHVFDAIDGYSPAEWDNSLIKELEKTEKAIAASEKALRHMQSRLQAAIQSGHNAMELRKNKKESRVAAEEAEPKVTEVQRLESRRKLKVEKSDVHGEEDDVKPAKATKSTKPAKEAGEFLPVADKKEKVKNAIKRAKQLATSE